MKKALIFILIVLDFATSVRSQDKTRDRNLSVLPVPAIGYSPETKTYVGAVTLFTFKNAGDSLSRTSNAKVEFNYTWNKQLIIESGWNYFSPMEKWFTRGIVHYSKYPDLYYGIGSNTTEEGEVSYQSNRFIIETDLLKNLGNKFFFGGGLNYKSYSNIRNLRNDISYPELKSKKNIGLKMSVLKDDRNNILSPSKGHYFEMNNSFNIDEYFYSVFTFDYRNYFEFGKKNNQVFAGRIFHTSVFGNAPFYDYAEIGGDKYVRGYYLGRFRDKNLSFIQVEYRYHLFWRIGMATFGGISTIYKNIASLEKQNIKPNAGLGIRFLVDKKENTNLRLDYAIGTNNQSGFYISFGESF